eukprot:TRINITY_DN9810_c0_g1_i1.p1 TRINITY_DN9810_c0_g1~~TRINITY_DN9810_c0_g1_i1.p1  ORF type:complete len:257 (+),score=46.34 TRINITY_DN9810_c0_g1_i1:65-835(+)
MRRRAPRSTHCISSAASDVYKRQVHGINNSTGDNEEDNSNNENDLEQLENIMNIINQLQAARRNNQRRVLQQRYHGFDRNNSKTFEILKQNIETILMIQQSEIDYKHIHQNTNQISTNHLVNPFNFEKQCLKVGQWIDVKDTVNEWLEAQIVNKRNNEILVHYFGWNQIWDEWIDQSSNRVALFRTHTVQQPNSIYLSPNPIQSQDQNQLKMTNSQTVFEDFIYDIIKIMNDLIGMLFGYQELQSKIKVEQCSQKN